MSGVQRRENGGKKRGVSKDNNEEKDLGQGRGNN